MIFVSSRWANAIEKLMVGSVTFLITSRNWTSVILDLEIWAIWAWIICLIFEMMWVVEPSKLICVPRERMADVAGVMENVFFVE